MSATQLAAERARPVRLPVPAALAGIVLVAAGIHAALALRSPSPWIVPDELVYSELAKSLGAGGLPRIRGEVSLDYGLGYPLLLAPLWALFEHVPTAYAVAKTWNALIMSLAAMPAYLLARRFVDERASLVVAGLTVAVPSFLYAGTLMTEVALYPAFLLALLAIARALERPRLATQAGALGAIALACSIKMLAVVLVPAYVVSIALCHWLDRGAGAGWRRVLRAYAPTWLALVALLAVLSIGAALRDTSPAAALGAYAVVLGEIDPRSIPRWALLHLAELDLYVAVIPFAATAAVVASGLRRQRVAEKLFAALMLPATLGVILAVAAYSSKPHAGAVGFAATEARLHERATFLLAPLLFLGLALWLRGRPWHGRRLTILLAGLGSAALPAAIPLDRLVENVRFQALALVPWVAVDRSLPWLAIALPVCAALAAVFVRASFCPVPAAVPVALVLAALLLVGWAAHGPMRWASEWTREQAWGERADWVDAAVSPTAVVPALWYEPAGAPFADPAPRHRVLWIGELFNRSLGRVYEIGSSMPYALPSTRVRLAGDRVVTRAGSPLEVGPLLFVPCHVRPVGDPVALDRQTGAAVYRVARPLRVELSSPGSCGPERG